MFIVIESTKMGYNNVVCWLRLEGVCVVYTLPAYNVAFIPNPNSTKIIVTNF